MDQPIKEIRILMLEDVPSDAELVKSELQDDGLVFVSLRVDTREAFEQALDEFKPDIILADYRLPAYNGHDALEYTRRTHPQIPVIMVTGVLGDEAAVELLKLGARDYVLKNSMTRLAPAIKRALSEERGIRNRKLAEGKYKALFSQAMDGIVLIDCETWHVVDCNPEFERQTGRTLDQLKEMKVWELLQPEQYKQARRLFLEVRKSRSGRSSSLEFHRPDGVIIPFEYAANYLDIQQHIFIQCVTHNITERKHSEQIILEEKSFSESVIHSLPDIFYLIDRQGTLLRWSRKGAELLGVPPEEMSGANVSSFIHEEDRPLIVQKINEAFETGSAETETRMLMKKGVRNYFLTATRIETKHGENVIGVGIDITERKNAEEALVRANRALKTLSAANLALVRAKNEDELLHSATSVIVKTGGYLMAWVGYAEDDAAKTVRPVAQCGYEEGYLGTINISWADTERGQGPTGTSIREGVTVLNQDYLTNPKMAPWREAALKRGYQSSIAIPLVRAERVFGSLTIYSAEPSAFSKDEVILLEELASDLAFGIETLRIRFAHEQHATLLRQSLEQSIQTIADTVEARDPYTAGHQRRVAELATAIAHEMDLPEDQINGIHLAAMIHDLGKIHIPAEILSKPGKLNDIEFMLIKTHSQAGYDILKDVKFPWPIADIILQHHERLDGSGYPQGLKGEQILLEARILTVADVVEAMSSHRPYRPTLGVVAALSELDRGRGSTYDVAVADVCMKLFTEKGFKFGS